MYISSTFTGFLLSKSLPSGLILIIHVYFIQHVVLFLSQGRMMPDNKYEDEIKEMEAKEEILQEVSSNTLLMPLR